MSAFEQSGADAVMIGRGAQGQPWLPGQIARVSARFDKPGTYPFFCHEYCGLGHHAMFGKVVVEPRS